MSAPRKTTTGGKAASSASTRPTGTKPAASKSASTKPKPAPKLEAGFEQKALDHGHDAEAFYAALDQNDPLVKRLAKHKSIIYRIALVAATLLPLVPAILLLVWISLQRDFGGSFPYLVETYRSDVQVIVSMIVSSLTYLNFLTISALFRALDIELSKNFVFTFLLSNVGLKDEPASDVKSKSEKAKDGGTDDDSEDKGLTDKQLDSTWNFIFGGKWTWSEFFIGCACFAVLYAPHIIWQGALTPSVVVRGLEQTTARIIPIYSSGNTEFNWANNDRVPDGNDTACDPLGSFQHRDFFDACPASSIQSTAWTKLQTASFITANTTGYNTNFKPDNSSYFYVGRSYGVGSAAGVLSRGDDTNRGIDIGRTYIESGYSTKVSCFFNQSSNVALSQVNLINIGNTASSRTVRLPSLYQLTGATPDGRDITNGSVIVADKSGDAVSWALNAPPSGGQPFTGNYTLTIAAAGASYARFNNIQCNVLFSPANYNITQSYDSFNVTVNPQTPTPGSPPVTDIDPSRRLTNTAMLQLAALSDFQSSPYASELGSALDANLQVVQFLRDIAKPDAIDIAESVADVVTVVLDDLLEYVGAAQLALFQNGAVDFTPLVERVRLGDRKWNITAMVMTALLFAIGVARGAYKLVDFTRKEKLEKTKREGYEAVEHGTPRMVHP